MVTLGQLVTLYLAYRARTPDPRPPRAHHQPVRWAHTAEREEPAPACRRRRKVGYLELTAISAPMRAALERYLRLNPRVGDAPLFPNLKHPGAAISRNAADHLLRRAEEVAKLPKLDRGLWHPKMHRPVTKRSPATSQAVTPQRVSD